MPKDPVLKSIRLFPKQIEQAITDVDNLDFSEDLKKAQNIIIAGMGGSLFSYHIISSLYSQLLTVPLVAINEYRLPSFVNSDSLVIGSSYSGATEETLQVIKEAKAKSALLTGITVGSELSELLQSYNATYYKLNPEFNPSGQPRIGAGYMIFGVIAMLIKLGYLNITFDEILTTVKTLEIENESLESRASSLADELNSTMLIYVASEHLNGTAHVVRNQTNETAKTFAEYNLVPELNHHFMEGLTYPKDKNLTFVFYNSKLYSTRVQKRMSLTREVIEKQGIRVVELSIEANNPTEQVMKYLLFGSFLTYYLAMKNNVDPSEVHWVDYFKEKLA